MAGYGEDRPEVLLNRRSLEEEFGLNSDEPKEEVKPSQITNMRNQLMEVEDRDEPDDILYTNIERANRLLDRAEEEILAGGQVNARLIEVCGQLINSITSASNSITGNSFNSMKHEYNMEMLKVKQQEVAVKAAIAQGGAVPAGGADTVVVMDRESLLKMMEEEDQGTEQLPEEQE